METQDFSRHLSAMMAWHFSPNTGSPFWLQRRSTLPFDPLTDIRQLSDLAMFPDISLELRHTPVEALMPRGLVSEPLAGVFESGGTTGAAKRVLAYESWLDELVSWRLQNFVKQDSKHPLNTLAIVPTGPHIVGAINQRRARRMGGLCFSVDMDPRWVKKALQNGDHDGMRRYADHLLEQCLPILQSQSIAYLVATPPLLEAIAARPELVENLNSSLLQITWGGTHMSNDTYAYLKDEVFPTIPISASYGSTMILSDTRARAGELHQGGVIFDSFAPYALLQVVEGENRQPVAYGQRGQGLMHHVSRYAFFPNVLERDTAVRLPAEPGSAGDAVSEVRPLAQVANQTVIEGVY